MCELEKQSTLPGDVRARETAPHTKVALRGVRGISTGTGQR